MEERLFRANQISGLHSHQHRSLILIPGTATLTLAEETNFACFCIRDQAAPLAIGNLPPLASITTGSTCQ